MYFTTIVLLIISITSISTAPTNNFTIKSLLENDSRVEKLRSIPFVRGFCLRGNLDEFSESLCLSLYDVGLAFNKSQIVLTVEKKDYKSEGFCANLEQVIPAAPLNKETTVYNGSPWFKDILKNKEGQNQCGDKCFFTDAYDYSLKPSPICRFLFEQFSTIQRMIRLNNANSEKANQNVNKQETKVDEVLAKTSPDASIPDSSQINLNKQSAAPENSVDVAGPVINQTQTSNSSKSDPAMEVNKTSLENTSTNQTKLKVSAVVTTETKTAKDENALEKNEVKKIDLISPGKEDEKSKKPQENVDPNMNNDDGGNNIFDDPDDASPAEGLQDDKDTEYNDDEDGDNNRNAALKQPQANADGEAESPNDKDGPKVVDVSFQEDPDSNFFIYLCGVMFLCVFLYVLQQNRKKLLALCLEGRRGNRRNRERSRGGSKAVYSKLDCNLEEAIMSKKSLNGKSMDIIY